MTDFPIDDRLDDYNLDLNQVARMLAHRPHVNTVRRWAFVGVRDNKLHTVMIGGRRFTSAAAVFRFIASLNEPRTTGSPPQPQAADLKREARTSARAQAIFGKR